jgi:cation diffusion facilitator family transporter
VRSIAVRRPGDGALTIQTVFMSDQPNTKRTIIYALGANAAIGVAKLAAAIHTGSNAMLAEAVHSFADCGNQGLLLLGSYRADRPPTPNYPLGYGKAAFFWSFIVALILFSVGGLYSIYEGWHKLHAPVGLEAPWIAAGVLAFSLVMEFYSLKACLEEIRKAQRGRTLWRWFRETRQSDLIVVLGEDVAALLGLALAMVAVLATILTENPIYDALGSIAIGPLLVAVAIGIALEIAGLLIGQSVEPETRRAIQEVLESHDDIQAVFNVITLQLGGDVMVAVKARMKRCSTAADLVAAINRCEQSVKSQFPQVQWVFFEPDVSD